MEELPNHLHEDHVMRNRLITTLSVFLLMLAILPVNADPYSLLFGFFPDPDKAEATRIAAEDAGFWPITTYANRNDTTTVLFGPFEYEAEAHLAKRLLKEKCELDSQITYMPCPNKRFEIPPFFSLDKYAGPIVPSLKGNPEYEKLEALDTKGNKEAYGRALGNADKSIQNNDPLKGYIRLNLGIIEIINKDYDRAMGLLLPVANGEVASATSNRVMAMIRVAWIIHRKNDRLIAYQAYGEIERWSTSEAIKAKCRAERIGLLMELAESGKGSHKEMRREVEAALQEIPGDDIRNRATIELMNLESYARQGNNDDQKSLELGEQFIEKYGALGDKKPLRELGSCIYQTGYLYLKNDNPEKARQKFEQVFTMVPPDSESFEGLDSHSQALNGLSNLALQEGDRPTSEQIMRDIVEQYPTSHIAVKILKAYPDIKERYQPTSAKKGEEK